MGGWRTRAAAGGLAITLASCGGAVSSAAPSKGSTLPPTPIGSGASSELLAAGGSQAPALATETVAGVTLSVDPVPVSTSPGGTLDLRIAIHNGRSTGLGLGPFACGEPVDVHADIPMPGLDPAGKTWSGVAADFKAFVLAMPADQSTNFKGANVVYGSSGPCDDAADGPSIAPGADFAVTEHWTADIVKGVPAPGLATALQVAVQFDEIPRPTPDPSQQVVGSWVRTYENMIRIPVGLTIEGPVPARHAISAAQAIDGLLANAEFVRWLGTKPESTWSLANAFIRGPLDGLPAAWEFDLFREKGVARTFAIGWVDVFTGDVLKTSYCNDPCTR